MTNPNNTETWVSPRALAEQEKLDRRDMFEVIMTLTDKCGLNHQEAASVLRLSVEDPARFEALLEAMSLTLLKETVSV